MSMTSSRPLDQPNHRRAARNVTRDSSTPLRTSSCDARLLPDPLDDRVAVRRLAHRGRGEGEELLDALVLGDLEALAEELDEPHRQVVADEPVRSEVLGQAQVDLVGERRQGVGAGVRVHDEQVDGVGPDVDDAQPHPSTLAGLGEHPLNGP